MIGCSSDAPQRSGIALLHYPSYSRVRLQAIKIFDFLQYLFASDTTSISRYGQKWLLVDLLYCIGLGQLRIPRLNYATTVIVLQVLSLWLLDGLLFGGIRLHLFGGSGSADMSGTQQRFSCDYSADVLQVMILLLLAHSALLVSCLL